MSLKVKLVITSAVITLIALVGFGVYALSLSTGMSIMETVLYAMETDEAEATAEVTETEESSDEVLPDIEIEGAGFNLETYYKAYCIDYSRVPNDIKVPGDYASIPGWSAKSISLAYLLAAEICTRPEINPPDATVIIKPEHLISEWFCEGGFYGTSSAEDLIPINTYCTWVAREHTWSIGAVGPFGQMYDYYSGSATAIGCIYISKLENPTIEDSKRAILGERTDIYSGKGRYITEELWVTNYKALSQASYTEISANIKQGEFDSAKQIEYSARPACYYLPDAMYSHALGLRAGLLGKSYNEAVNGNGSDMNLKSITALVDARTANCSDTNYSDIMLSMSYGQYVGANWDDYINTSTGMIGKLYKSLVRYNIPIRNETVTSLYGKNLFLSGGGSMGTTLMTGMPSSEVLSQLQAFFEELSAIESSSAGSHDIDYYAQELSHWFGFVTDDDISKLKEYISASLLWQLKMQLIKNNDQDGEYLFQSFSSDYDEFCSLHRISDQTDYYNYRTYPFYGITCVNGAYMLAGTLEGYVNGVFELYGNAKQYNSLMHTGSQDVISGRECLGDGCLHDAVTTRTLISADAYTDLTLAERKFYVLYSNIPWDTSVQNYIDQSTVLDLVDSNVADVSYTSDGIYPDPKRILYSYTFKGLSAPIKTDLKFATYEGHGGCDIISGTESTFGQEVYPVAPGVIVGITEFPYSGLGTSWPARGMNGYGNLVIVLHKMKDGTYFYSFYAHLDHFAHIKLGSAVSTDTVLGYADSTGQSTGSHLHLELKVLTGTPSGKYSYINQNYTAAHYIALSIAGSNYTKY